ncbi:MAG TPA: FmdB family zinc ribbon protein [Thermoanaerobaculia bacterium]|nr:FmdB family zinc ribbon protein [Thermoanaerobaculia bacterium]
MPIYEYQCQTCGKRTEVLQRLDEAPLAACPECGGGVKKLLSAPAFQFKGSGWYVTDYASKKGGAPDGKSESKGGKPETKDGKASEPAKDTAAKTAPAGASSRSAGSE